MVVVEEDMAVAAEEDAGDTDKDKGTRSFKHQQHIKEIKIFTNLVSVYLTSALWCNVKRRPTLRGSSFLFLLDGR